MEGTKQAQEIFNTWIDTQKKMWDEWFKATQGFGKAQGTEAWRKTVEVWEQSLKKNLNLQMEWTKLWADGFTSVHGTPEELLGWAQQGQDMMRRWAETQIQLWEGWFGVVKKLDPSILSGNWEQESQKVVLIWQEAVKKALDAQVEWGRVWTEGQASRKPKDQAKT